VEKKLLRRRALLLVSLEAKVEERLALKGYVVGIPRRKVSKSSNFYFGGLSDLMMARMTVLASVPCSDQGGFEVIISMTQQARLQMSVGLPCPTF